MIKFLENIFNSYQIHLEYLYDVSLNIPVKSLPRPVGTLAVEKPPLLISF